MLNISVLERSVKALFMSIVLKCTFASGKELGHLLVKYVAGKEGSVRVLSPHGANLNL